MNSLRLLSMMASRSWDRFATQIHIRELPALPTVVVILALGIGIPLAADVQTTPPELTESLALQRLQNFYKSKQPSAMSATPAGRIVDPRPTIAWPRIHGAKSYAMSLLNREGSVLYRRSDLTELSCELPETMSLGPGTYTIKVSGVGGEGHGSRIESTFEVLAALPQGYLIFARPACRWLPVENAVRYRVRIQAGDGQVVVDRETIETALRIRAPGNLSPDEYRLEAVGIDANGNELPFPRVTSFVVRAAPSEGDALTEAMALELEAAESDLVRAGYYAENGSEYDVLSALESYLERPGASGEGAAIARKVLALHGVN